MPIPTTEWFPLLLARWKPVRTAVLVVGAVLAGIAAIATGVAGWGLWLDLAAIACAFVATWLPPAWLGVGVLFAVSLLVPVETPGLAVFVLLIGLFDVSVESRPWLRFTMLVLAIAGAVIWSTEYLLGGAIVGALFFAAWMSGAMVRVVAIQSSLRLELEVARGEAERIGLARDMHDVVAGSISHVVLSAAELLARTDLSTQTRQQVEGIREEARTTLVELRQVIGLLRTKPTASAAPADLTAQWLRTRGMLVSCGFTLDAKVELEPDASRAAISVLTAALRELGANAVRHGDSAGPVSVTLNANRDRLNLIVSNRIRPANPDLPTSGTGLEGLRERLAQVGGTITTQCDAGQWMAVVRIPRWGNAEGGEMTESERDDPDWTGRRRRARASGTRRDHVSFRRPGPALGGEGRAAGGRQAD